jgi:hypothetical protein
MIGQYKGTACRDMLSGGNKYATITDIPDEIRIDFILVGNINSHKAFFPRITPFFRVFHVTSSQKGLVGLFFLLFELILGGFSLR